MKKPLGRVIPKKIMAYPKTSERYDYDTFLCFHCKEEYLSEGIIDHESIFCPKHTDYEFCYQCDSSFSKDEMKVDRDEFYYCSDCYFPKCIECGEAVNDEQERFCSQQCANEYWVDLDEDDYKTK